MALYSKESLESLRQKINLVEIVSSYIELKPAGSNYKGLCPFHDEKTPSFVVAKGDSHYHCFGCGAHGDAIQFLISQQSLTFVDAVNLLAQRFHVNLEKVGGEQEKGPNKKQLKEALLAACHFYHFMLLHSREGQDALAYLYKRGIDLDFIAQFQIGLAPREPGLFRQVLFAKGFSQQTLIDASLLSIKSTGKIHDFFYDRIIFPICDAMGAIIGFSARKYREETTGGKYINSSETVLFKKSKVLFALNYSRKRIAKERRAIIVEGQVDALRLIESGLALAVASQGTAFGESHAKELIDLGVEQVFLAFDSDKAGQAAVIKVGQLFQKEGVAVQQHKMIEVTSGQ